MSKVQDLLGETEKLVEAEMKVNRTYYPNGRIPEDVCKEISKIRIKMQTLEIHLGLRRKRKEFYEEWQERKDQLCKELKIEWGAVCFPHYGWVPQREKDSRTELQKIEHQIRKALNDVKSGNVEERDLEILFRQYVGQALNEKIEPESMVEVCLIAAEAEHISRERRKYGKMHSDLFLPDKKKIMDRIDEIIRIREDKAPINVGPWWADDDYEDY